MASAALVQWVWEGVELPGEPIDYHFLLQNVVKELWSRRRSDPDAVYAAENFAYLDLNLIEAVPDLPLINGLDPAAGFVRLPGIEILCMLLKREGAFREADEIARRWERFGGNRGRLDVAVRAERLAEEPA